WTSFNDTFNGNVHLGTLDSYPQLVDLAPTKPIMIGEIGASENSGSKSQWITDMLQNQLPNQFPQIKAFVWFDAGVDLSYGLNWTVNSSPSALKAFISGISSPVYAGNAYGTLN